LSLSLFISVFISVSISVSVFVSLYFYPYLCLYLFLCLCLCLSLSLSLSLSHVLSLSLFVLRCGLVSLKWTATTQHGEFAQYTCLQFNFVELNCDFALREFKERTLRRRNVRANCRVSLVLSSWDVGVMWDVTHPHIRTRMINLLCH